MCITSALVGTAAVVGSFALFYWTLEFLFYLDGRYYVGRYPFISLPAMAVIFIAGFRWRYLRASRRR
jgi:hypothetical protein